MAYCILQDLLSKNQQRYTDRAAFARAVSRLSCARTRKDDVKKQAKNNLRAA